MGIIKKYYNVDRKDIGFLKFIFEAYDGMAVVTTMNSDKDLIMLRIARGFEEDVEIILDDLRQRIRLEPTVME